MDKDFVEYIAKAIVDNPDDVRAVRSTDDMGVLITLHVNPKDLGQVIGRQGETANAIRTLLRIIGAKTKARVTMKIAEPEGHKGPRKQFTQDGKQTNQNRRTTEFEDFDKFD